MGGSINESQDWQHTVMNLRVTVAALITQSARVKFEKKTYGPQKKKCHILWMTSY